MISEKRFTDAKKALEFILSGNAIFTLRSSKTGNRYTYRIKKSESTWPRYFVSLLTGPENSSDYTYLGVIESWRFRLTGKSRMPKDSLPVSAISWTVDNLRWRPETALSSLEVWHEGRCGRCARPLTVPESIESGYGPECSQILEKEKAA